VSFTLYAPGTRKGNSHWIAIIRVDGQRQERSMYTTDEREARLVAGMIEREMIVEQGPRPGNVVTSPPISTPAPLRRRGRPPITPGEAKRFPLSLYVTRALKDELVQAAKLSGVPLTTEIEARLWRTLDQDRSKDKLDLQLDRITDRLRDFMSAVLRDTEIRDVGVWPAEAHQSGTLRKLRRF